MINTKSPRIACCKRNSAKSSRDAIAAPPNRSQEKSPNPRRAQADSAGRKNTSRTSGNCRIDYKRAQAARPRSVWSAVSLLPLSSAHRPSNSLTGANACHARRMLRRLATSEIAFQLLLQRACQGFGEVWRIPKRQQADRTPNASRPRRLSALVVYPTVS